MHFFAKHAMIHISSTLSLIYLPFATSYPIIDDIQYIEYLLDQDWFIRFKASSAAFYHSCLFSSTALSASKGVVTLSKGVILAPKRI